MPSTIDRVRKICLALPEAHEVEAWGAPTFRVKNKLFAMYAEDGNNHGGRVALWIKSTHVNQDLLIQTDRERFFAPPYVGPSGWVGMYLDKRPDWEILASIVKDAYLLTAPKRLGARISGD
ncbi:MAG TPA: MmcQ/YjbR family DNA-binding protein [Gemmatimonadaceae bacterium]